MSSFMEVVGLDLMQYDRYVYLNFKNKIVTSEGKSNDTNSIKNGENLLNLWACKDGVVTDPRNSAFGHRDGPDERRVSDCCQGTNKGHPSYRVQVWKLRQNYSNTCEK